MSEVLLLRLIVTINTSAYKIDKTTLKRFQQEWKVRSEHNKSISQHIQEMFQNDKGMMRIRQSKKDRQYNGQKKKDKGISNDLQNHAQKYKH
jgi:hypothetical protein